MHSGKDLAVSFYSCDHTLNRSDQLLTEPRSLTLIPIVSGSQILLKAPS